MTEQRKGEILREIEMCIGDLDEALEKAKMNDGTARVIPEAHQMLKRLGNRYELFQRG